ncbi:BACON domain-containing protein [Streptomyces sp. NPDC002513]
MMSSRPETSTHPTGARPARKDARKRGSVPRGANTRTTAQRPTVRFEPYLDGLFTYCLSVLCDHDTATAALGDALALAGRRGTRGPTTPDDCRAWLYALARWSCLRRLAEARRRRHTGHPAGRDRGSRAYREAGDRRAAQAIAAAAPGGAGLAPEEAVPEEVQHQRRRELAELAWPEAAGTTPEQREALELAVRHQLTAQEVAAVLGMDLAAARELLASAACEVERTRAALAVVETGSCPSVARLTDDHHFVLSATLRRELVRHVDDCPRCRRTAERAVPGAWPGTSVTPAALPVLGAPRTALHAAMAQASRARGDAPRFDRRGFPMDPKDHAARRDRLRARAVTTTVVAAVVAAPVIALWAAYRGAPLTGEGTDGRPVTSRELHDSAVLGGGGSDGYENAGNARTGPGVRFGKDGRSPDVSVEVIGVRTGAREAAHLTVAATGDGTTTLITLTASGSAPVSWSASTGASWLSLSQTSGTLAPGASITVRVYVDPLREPSGPWHARVAVAPAGAVVSIDGYGTAGLPDPRPTPVHTGPSAPAPSDPPTTGPEPTPGDPTPTDPPTTSPTPSPDPSAPTSPPPGTADPSPSS